jgi:hypothetical protein
MSAATHLLQLYAFKARTATTLPLPFTQVFLGAFRKQYPISRNIS